jgi:hypothetical protein
MFGTIGSCRFCQFAFSAVRSLAAAFLHTISHSARYLDKCNPYCNPVILMPRGASPSPLIHGRSAFEKDAAASNRSSIAAVQCGGRTLRLQSPEVTRHDNSESSSEHNKDRRVMASLESSRFHPIREDANQ